MRKKYKAIFICINIIIAISFIHKVPFIITAICLLLWMPVLNEITKKRR